MSATSTATLAKHAVEWSVVLSCAMILAGIVGIIAPTVAGITVTVLAGWLLIFSGIAHFVFGWERRTTGVLAWELLVGILYIVVGSYLLLHIALALVALTIVLGIYLGAEAILEFVLAYRMGVEDALIAATALDRQDSLATGNEKHFRMIPGLELKVFRP